jgi:hypothetical protein
MTTPPYEVLTIIYLRSSVTKYTKITFFTISTLLQRLATIKILWGGSPLASLSITLNNDVVAILYKILGIGGPG